MRPIIAAALAFAALPATLSAQNYRAVNYLTVVPLTGASFEVIEAHGEGSRGMWCAAADYAERKLNATDRVYIAEPRGPSKTAAGRKSVVFTTDAASLVQGPSRSVSVDTSQVGIGLPIAHAIQFCRDADYDLGALRLRG